MQTFRRDSKSVVTEKHEFDNRYKKQHFLDFSMHQHFDARIKINDFSTQCWKWKVLYWGPDDRNQTYSWEENQFEHWHESILKALSGIYGLSRFYFQDQNAGFFIRFLIYNCEGFNSDLDGGNHSCSYGKIWVRQTRWIKAHSGNFSSTGFWCKDKGMNLLSKALLKVYSFPLTPRW